MKEFTTAAKRVEDEDAPSVYTLEWKIDDVPCRARRPKDGQLAVLMATTGRHVSESEKISGIINFFVAVLDEPSHHYIVGRLLDSDDTFGIEEVQDIMEWMIEEWTGRPTQSPSVSTGSQSNGGANSTQPMPVST